MSRNNQDPDITTITDQQEEPLYVLNDTPIRDDEDSRFDSIYELEEEIEEEIDADQPAAYGREADNSDAKKSRKSPLGLMFRTMLTPVEGWKALKRAKLTSEEVAARAFYPLLALAAISEASSFFYEANYTFSEWAVSGLVTFISFFFGYFTVLLAASIFLPKELKELPKKDICKQMVLLASSTLPLFYVLGRMLPMLDAVLVFLPIWTIYIVFKGIRLLRVPKEKENTVAGIFCTLTVGCPIFWMWLLSEYIFPAF